MGKTPSYEELEKLAKSYRRKDTGPAREVVMSLSFLEDINDGFFITDEKGSLLYINKTLVEMFGYDDKKELVGKSFIELVAPEVRDGILQKFKKAVLRKEFRGTTVPVTTLKKDGSLFFVELKSAQIKERGQIVGTKGIIRDITERKKAENKQADSQDFLRTILEAIDSLLVVIDKDLRIVLTNWKDHDWVPKEKRGKGLYCYEAFKNFDSPCENCPVLKTFKDGEFRFYEEQNPIDKSFKAISVIPIKDAGGSVKYVLENVRDVTAQKKAVKEKITAQQFAAEQEKHALVGQIAGKIAHDFNNILGAIMGNAELGLLELTDPQLRKPLEIIFDQGIRGKNLTRNLVAFAKDTEIKQEYFWISEKITLVLELLKRELEGIEVIREERKGIPELLADPGMIEHALVNLVQNSIHATSLTKTPCITIRTYCENETIFIEIEDNGCGIPEEHMDNIYKPSFTLKGGKDVNRSYKKEIQGTGYGMANVKKYIEQHKGSVSVKSKHRAGTVFFIGLPVIRKELTVEEKTQIQSQEPVSGKYILLVEDELPVSEVQYQILTKEPCCHRVDIASNGRMALDLLKRNTYDVVSIDYVLPGEINGMDIYNQFRKTNTATPVLFFSGNLDFLESVKKIKGNDPRVDHLSKPCQLKEYIDHINGLLNLHTNK